MSDPELVRSFLRDGFLKYTAALEAVEFFEQQILDAINSTFADRPLKNFRRKKEEGQPAAPRRNPYNRGGTSRSISAFIEADQAPVFVCLTLGVLWNPPKLPKEPVVFYGHIWQGKSLGPLEDRDDRDRRVHLGATEGKARRMWLTPSKDIDMKGDFGLLIEAVDAAHSPVTAAGEQGSLVQGQ